MIKVNGDKVTRIDRDAESVSIPQKMKCIGNFACFNGSLKLLDLKDSNIQIIEKYAFTKCFLLEKVIFPSCLEKIDEGSFQNCEGLINIVFDIKSKLREIGKKAFMGCIELENIEFPHCLMNIGDGAFEGCTKMKIFDLRCTAIKRIGNFVNNSENISVYLPPIFIENNIYLSINSEEGHPAVKNDGCGYFVYKRRIYQGNKKRKNILIRRGTEMISFKCFYKSALVSITIPASVTIICKCAFNDCKKLVHIRFAKNSQLKEIGIVAFESCVLIKKVVFPKSLRVIGFAAFEECESLEKAIFPKDSQLEEIIRPFSNTIIRHLSLPQSIKKIQNIVNINELESIYVSNDLYKSNMERTAIFSKDGHDLVCVIKRLKHFEIPDSVRVIKKSAFQSSEISGHLIIPNSVEIIEENAFLLCRNLRIVEFTEGSKLKLLGDCAFSDLDDLIINNENFIKRSDGVVMSRNPVGIVFVPRHLTELKVDYGVECIQSFSFSFSRIKSISFPKSLKKIGSYAFDNSELVSITFEEGTELDNINNSAFAYTEIEYLKLPIVKKHLGLFSIECRAKTIEFPSNFNPLIVYYKSLSIYNTASIICPFSSLQALAQINFNRNTKVIIIEDQ